MVTDPPYGVGYESSWRSRRKVSRGQLAQGKVLNDDRADWREAYALFAGDVAYVWHGALHGDVIAADLAGCGLQPRAQIIWSKQHFTLGRGDYHWKHETCWYAVRDGKTSHWQGDRTQKTVWEIPNNNPFGNPQHEQSWGHGTQKPVAIANNSRPGQAVYDPFLGSGTSVTALAGTVATIVVHFLGMIGASAWKSRRGCAGWGSNNTSRRSAKVCLTYFASGRSAPTAKALASSNRRRRKAGSSIR